MIVRISYACAKSSLPLEVRGLLGLEPSIIRSGIDASEADAIELRLPAFASKRGLASASSGNDNRRVSMCFAS